MISPLESDFFYWIEKGRGTGFCDALLIQAAQRLKQNLIVFNQVILNDFAPHNPHKLRAVIVIGAAIAQRGTNIKLGRDPGVPGIPLTTICRAVISRSGKRR